MQTNICLWVFMAKIVVGMSGGVDSSLTGLSFGSIPTIFEG